MGKLLGPTLRLEWTDPEGIVHEFQILPNILRPGSKNAGFSWRNPSAKAFLDRLSRLGYPFTKERKLLNREINAKLTKLAPGAAIGELKVTYNYYYGKTLESIGSSDTRHTI